MDESPNLDLPYLMPAQAQKHITHNEALARLDVLVQLSVIDRDLSAPPGSPAEGDRYIVAAGGSGAWTGWDLAVASFGAGAWTALAPRPGWLCWIADEAQIAIWDGEAWQPLATFGGPIRAPMVGVNATPDATNPFSATVNRALWTALSAGSGGDGDLRFTMNKETSADVLSVLLQANWSARAEFGLIGGDDLTFKVSPDGSTWFEAIVADRSSGRVALPSGLRSAIVAALPSPSPAGQLLYVSDGTSNKRLAVSDGSAWRWPDGAVVS